ncbi:T9SS type A sorting domain-containing protein [Pontibacter sp. Tf4]|uniref:T9SS type A sorting domain-containing protein n=1 Tax=Pontibacter sp. Tf4 TaxID=2761620 RepID=UPI0016259A80|nr:T9SS type A sorting domain-containing protein [Pontibacter sp. Tf4]MBB6610743.1 T9SS type A sorting domain-containing protein [Pontibacter sp. Tf4]
MNLSILQHFFKLAISLLLALLPVYSLLAQDTKKEQKPEKMRVKVLKYENGDLIYSSDTVISAADHEKHMKALRKLDAVDWKKLDGMKGKVDSLYANKKLRELETISYRIAGDTALMGKIKEVRVLRGKAMSDDERALLFERLETIKGDSFIVKALNGAKVMTLHGDSLQNKHIQELIVKGKPGRAFSIMGPGDGSDSTHTIVRITGPEGVRMQGKHAIVYPGDIKARYSTSDKIRIETDETGKTTVYEIDGKGNKKEIDAYHFGRSGEKSTVILMDRTRIERITEDDKKTLKEAGVKVEKSEKKELKIEDLSYYPNPSSGQFNVSFTLLEKGQATIKVLNSAGKQVYQEKLDKNARQYAKQLDLTGMGTGIFYLQVEQNGRTLTKRLLVK